MDDRLTGSPLEQLARACGIEPGYHDVRGKWHATDDATRRLLLTAMGHPAADDNAVAASLGQLELEKRRSLLEPVYVLRRRELAAGIRLAEGSEQAGTAVTWRVVEEWGREHLGAIAEQRVALPETLSEGYHRLLLLDGERTVSEAALIIVPERAYLPPEIEGGGRLWGATVQVHSLTSPRNAGVGDYTDLLAAAEIWARQGAAVLGHSPLHALSLRENPAASPYSPSSRLFHNTMLVDVEAVAEFEGLKADDPRAVEEYRREAEELRATPLVEYPRVAALKRRMLELLHARFQTRADPARRREFETYLRRKGEALRRHALHAALEDHHGGEGARAGWRGWPPELHDPASPAVREFELAHPEAVSFHEYAQWQAESQLAAVAARCHALEMPVGLYADLAVSVAPGGSEAWGNQGAYAIGVNVGAPPDEFNSVGQDWGIPPFIPDGLQRLAYAPFVAMLRANMAHAGALRIDHAMGLLRLYWVPEGRAAHEGAYVRYPLEDLVGLVALESHRHRCLVIGEDLGTVPPELFDRFQAANLFSMRLLLFERDGDGRFRSAGVYPRKAAVSWSTHDLPTVSGWWKGADESVRRELVTAFGDQRLMRGGAPSRASIAVATALHRFLARTPAALALVQMEDALGVVEQANVPGINEHPNWRRKYPVVVEQLQREPRLRAIARTFAAERGGARPVEAKRTAARIPRATYRLQLHKDFTLRDATRLIPYLAALGVSHIYCSPYLKARTGSRHGYDIVDHNTLNPEIGTRADLDAFVRAMRAHGMAHMLDIVPNHMGVMCSDNAWWMDVLENGPASAYAEFFDIEWQSPAPHLAGRVILPLLGDHYGRELARGALELAFEPAQGTFAVHVNGHRLPIDPATYPSILQHAENDSPELARISTELAKLPSRDDRSPESVAARHERKQALQADLARLAREDAAAGAALDQAALHFRGTPGDAASFDALHALIEAQAWRAAFWRVAADEINYRRFFDINELAALRMENEAVFEATHRLVLSLVREGCVEALRIDHPDGLFDPRRYFERLQRACARAAAPAIPDGATRSTFVVVEKIIAPYENLPRDWPVHGTTGYRFANVVNGLFVDASARSAITRIYQAFSARREPFSEVDRESRRLVLRTALSGELYTLAHQLSRIALADRDTQDYTASALRQALAEVIAAFPVYRTYVTEAASEEDRRFITWAVRHARQGSRAADATVFAFIERLLLVEAYPPDDPRHGPALQFARRFQQLCAPVMAKGVEDTAFYRYNRLLSLNDVGGDPDEFGCTVSRFHKASANRARTYPHTMLATSTHDNKRSEDVRARLNVISEDPTAWRLALKRWRRMNQRHKHYVDDTLAPSRNDEYLLYQTLLGSFPLGDPSEAELEDYRARIAAYLEKAMREAKMHTSWANVNEPYETAMQTFARALLASGPDNPFLPDLRALLSPMSWAGLLNSLAMTTVKMISPGVPDIYQGNELWDFSLVDPDNRREVDFDRRRSLLAAVSSPQAAAPEGLAQMLANLEDGRAKLFALTRLLALRRSHEVLFRQSGYTQARVAGSRSNHAIAFARRHAGHTVLCIAPRLFLKMGLAHGALPFGEALWGDTRVELPFLPPDIVLTDIFTGLSPRREGHDIALSDAIRHFPVSVLVSR